MGNKTLLGFVKDQRRTVAPVLKTDLSGKTVVVTGANTGLGLEAAKHFATMNPARLVLGCRNADKAKAAISEVEKATGYKNTEFSAVDLSSFASVSAFADRFEKDGGRLDLLVANAGIVATAYVPTPDGWESMLQVNHLSTVLVSLLLLPQMVQTARRFSTTPRLVIVSSEMHYWAPIDKAVMNTPNAVETMGSKEYCTPTVIGRRYSITKLLNIFSARALNSRLSPSPPITVNAVNPGFCYSGIRRNFRGLRSWMIWMMEKLLARTTEQGSRQLVYAAIGGKGEEEMRGAYISNEGVEEVSDVVLTEEGRGYQERVWEETIHILAKADPRIQHITTEYLTR